MKTEFLKQLRDRLCKCQDCQKNMNEILTDIINHDEVEIRLIPIGSSYHISIIKW